MEATVILHDHNIELQLPTDQLIEMLSNGYNVDIKMHRFRDRVYRYIAPDYVRPLLKEQEDLFEGLLIVKQSADEVWRWNMERIIRTHFGEVLIPNACGLDYCEQVGINLNGNIIDQMRAYIKELLELSTKVWDGDSVRSIFNSIAYLSKLRQINGAIDPLDVETYFPLALPFGHFRITATSLPNHIRLYWNEESLLSTMFYLSKGSFAIKENAERGEISVAIPIHPYWSQTVSVSDTTPEHPFVASVIPTRKPVVVHRLVGDKLFMYDREVDVPDEPDWNIPCDGREVTLFVPIPDADTLDLMMGSSVRLDDYKRYQHFSEFVYPVRVKLSSPLRVLHTLDRLATMLRTDIEITALPETEADLDDYRFIHPPSLMILLSQVLLQIHPPKTLTELAYRLIRMYRKLQAASGDFAPWQCVTLDGYRDFLSLCDDPFLLMRSRARFDDYVRFRLVPDSMTKEQLDEELASLFPARF